MSMEKIRWERKRKSVEDSKTVTRTPEIMRDYKERGKKWSTCTFASDRVLKCL